MGADVEVQYFEDGDLALFDGHKFRRDKKTGYYLCSTLHTRLHRYVWQYFNGTIPKGYHIHHKDENKENNDISNLELLEMHEHEQLHGKTMSAERRDWCRNNLSEKARPKASEWHRSAEGREWHKEQAKISICTIESTDHVCEYCGEHYMAVDHGTNRFCSNKCRSAYRRKMGYDNVDRVCAVCGNTFTVNKYSDGKACSRECAGVLRWQRVREKTTV